MRAYVCVYVLVLCLRCWFCGGPTVLALDVGDLQDGQQQLKCILNVVGTVGALQTRDDDHHHHRRQHLPYRQKCIKPF